VSPFHDVLPPNAVVPPVIDFCGIYKNLKFQFPIKFFCTPNQKKEKKGKIIKIKKNKK
jgi:hypothetical protein